MNYRNQPVKIVSNDAAITIEHYRYSTVLPKLNYSYFTQVEKFVIGKWHPIIWGLLIVFSIIFVIQLLVGAMNIASVVTLISCWAAYFIHWSKKSTVITVFYHDSNTYEVEFSYNSNGASTLISALNRVNSSSPQR